MVEQNTLEIIETVSQMNIKNGLIFLKSYLQYITLKKIKIIPIICTKQKEYFSNTFETYIKSIYV